MSLAGEEIKKEIIDLIHLNGKVEVNKLSETFDVTAETIRRYLNQLEEKGELKKVYGGAVKIQYSKKESPYFQRETLHTQEKKIIGKKAAELVQSNDLIFIDEGSTPLQMIPFIIQKEGLTIITNSFSSISKLMFYANKGLFTGDLIFLGGEVQSDHMRVEGTISENHMKNFYVDKAFISIDGLSINNGLTSISSQKATFVQQLISNSKESIVLADESKIGTRSYYKISELKEVNTIISNIPLPQNWKLKLKNYKTKWINA